MFPVRQLCIDKKIRPLTPMYLFERKIKKKCLGTNFLLCTFQNEQASAKPSPPTPTTFPFRGRMAQNKAPSTKEDGRKRGVRILP